MMERRQVNYLVPDYRRLFTFKLRGIGMIKVGQEPNRH